MRPLLEESQVEAVMKWKAKELVLGTRHDEFPERSQRDITIVKQGRLVDGKAVAA